MELKVESTIPIRIDRYLRKLYPANLTQGILEKSLRIGEIKLNGKKVQASRRLVKNDIIFLSSKINLQKFQTFNNVFSDSVIKLSEKIFKEYLIYDHEKFIVIDKPTMLATQSGTKISISIDQALKFLNHSKGNDYKLVHRLDKDTSGLLLIAKNYEASVILSAAFKDKLIHKTYVAITYSRPSTDNGEISCKIMKQKTGVFESVSENENEGKTAITQYKLLKLLGKMSLIEFIPITGRLHQIRFHALKMNCPIVGDKKYFIPEIRTNAKRLYLHAKKIILQKEIFGKEIIIETKIPQDFSKNFNID